MGVQLLPLQAQPAPLNGDTNAGTAKLDRAARDFEGLFAQQLIASMRQASFGDALFPGESSVYREFYDQHLAQKLTQGRGLGLAEAIRHQLGAASEGKEEPSVANPRNYSLAEYARALPARVVSSSAATLAQDLKNPFSGELASTKPRVADVWPESRLEKLAANLPARTPEDFVASIWPHAQKAAEALGVCPKVLVAQAALETGWGRHMPTRADGSAGNNLFGIKAGAGWRGERINAATREVVNGVEQAKNADFRAYDEISASFADYVQLLSSSPRYAQARAAGQNSEQFTVALQKAGYATDPHYAAKLNAIVAGPTLARALAQLDGVEISGV